MTFKEKEIAFKKGIERTIAWKKDWNKFIYEALGARLDPQQREIIDSLQVNPRTSVASGTARGKDFLVACGSLAFMYMTPKWDKNGVMVANTKVALTAPTSRQVTNIMKPEFTRLWLAAKRKGIDLPGRLVAADIRTEFAEWYLTGFKADDNSTESWSGFHAVNTMFAITEASGINQLTYDAIEGNLQGNSRILLVFNPNQTIGYAAESQKDDSWSRYRLNSLDAPNVIAKKALIPGQVDYNWVIDKISKWCTPIRKDEVTAEEDDFEFEGQWYRPEDIFRVKVLGKFPKVSADSLIPKQWIEQANQRWLEYHAEHGYNRDNGFSLRLGLDVAGMGRDSSVFAHRYGNLVEKFFSTNSGGVADHMNLAGMVVDELNRHRRAMAFIDTIGEGAAVYSRLFELEYYNQIASTKNSNKAIDENGRPLTDITGEYRFFNKRAYLHWAVRDFLNPKNGFDAMIPPDEEFLREATEIKYFWKSNGEIMIEPKEDIKARLKNKSPDKFDALSMTFDTPQFIENEDKSYLY